MGLRSNNIPLDEQIRMVDSMLQRFGPRKGHTQEQQALATVLKAIHANLVARQQHPRSLPLGELERALDRAVQSKSALGYEIRDLANIANVVIRRWPHIREALEWFGEETAQ